MSGFYNETEEIAKFAAKYERSKIERAFSGSMFGNTVLQNYLTIIDQRNSDEAMFKVGQNTIGSIFHAGMEFTQAKKSLEEVESNNVLTEHSTLRELPNGWTITGTIDRIDFTKMTIHDYKLTKIYKGRMLKKDIAEGKFEDGYVLQMNAYAWCLENIYSSYLDMFYKDANPLNNEDAYEEIFIPLMIGFEEYAVNITNTLEGHLDSGIIPVECDDLWWRKNKQKESIPTRCALYCGVKDICPYYKKHRHGGAASRIANF